MAIFCIQAPYSETMRLFMEKTNHKLKSDNVILNPFTGAVKLYPGDLDRFLIVITPIYPRIYFAGLLLIVLPPMFNQVLISWWQLPGLILLMFGFFWSKYFFYIMLRLGIRKNVGKISLKLYNIEDLLKTDT